MAITIYEQNWQTKETTEIVKYKGCVLRTYRDTNYRIMSDVWGTAEYALVWDEDKQQFVNYLVNVFDMHGDDWKPNVAEVDAPADLVQKYRAYLEKIELERLVSEANAKARQVTKEAEVVVRRGRDHKGEKGIVRVMIERPYNTGWKANTEYKLGVSLDDEKHEVAASNGKVYENYKNMIWVWARNVDRLDIAPVDMEKLKEQAAARASYKMKEQKLA